MFAVAKSRNSGCGVDHPVLVEQCQLPVLLQDALDDEHDVGPACVVFVEDQGDRSLDRPRQDAFGELGDLLTIPQRHGVAADQVHPAELPVEVHSYTRPVESRGDLFDVGGLSCAVQPLDQDATVAREAGEQRQRDRLLEAVGGIDVGDVLVPLGEGGHLQVRVDTEQVARGYEVGHELSCDDSLAATSASMSPIASAALRNAGSSLNARSGVNRMTGA